MIQVRNLTKTYGKVTALNDVSFEVSQGETVALLGPNGSGKTTLLKCMAGLTLPDTGKVQIGGLDATKNARQARQLFTFLPQRTGFQDSLTAREILLFFCRLRGIDTNRVDQILSATPFHFNGSSNRPVGEFSGGMLQRLGLAVACLPDAPVMLLDEPTVSLDPEGALQFRHLLTEMKQRGKTILFSSHLLADVEQMADRVVILMNGRLLAVESIEALREGLMQTCKMRILIQKSNPDLPEIAKRAGATESVLDHGSLLVTSHPGKRMGILQAIESSGEQIINFATEELSIEDIYMRYIHEHQNT